MTQQTASSFAAATPAIVLLMLALSPGAPLAQTRLTYRVEFPMFEKSSVMTLRTNPPYADLLARTGQAPKWNLHKYLIDRNGNPAGTFASRVEPDNRELLAPLEKLRADKPAAPKG
jgi:glutathione peroxidase